MTLISKISDKLSGSSSKNVDQSTTVAPGHGQSSTFGGQNSALDSTAGTTGSSSSTYGNEGTTGESMLRQNNSGVGTSSTGTTGSYGTDSTGQRHKGLGEKAKEAVGLDPKDGRDPKDIGYSQGSSTAYSGGNQSSYGTESRGIDRQSERMGDLSISNSERSKQTAAPIVAERVHDQYENVDKTRVEELHDRTKVQQTVQPVYDERTEATQRERQDHGLEVHEHGRSGLDSRTEAELAAKREQLSAEHRSTHDERTTERSRRPDVDMQSRTNTIEEVVPVLERDVYRPHEIEHNKKVVNIEHEAPEFSGTRTNKPISVGEWESKSGGSLHTTGATTGTGGLTSRTRRGPSSSSSSSDEEVEVDGVKTRRKKGLGEKIKEKVGLDPKDGRDPKDIGYNQGSSSSTGYNQSGTSGYGQQGVGSSSSTGYNQDSSTGYGQQQGVGSSSYGTDSTQYGAEGQRHKGIGEKAKETVGLDPKDGRDPKDAGYNQGSSSSTTGYNQSGTSGYGQQGIGSSSSSSSTGYNQGSSTGTGYSQSGTSGTTGTSGYADDSTETHRKKGFGEKIKEKLGLDPKDGQGDPKDAGYSTGSRGL